MAEAMGIRLDIETRKKIDMLSREESTDRSTIIRKLLKIGFEEISKERAAREYIEGKVTFSEAAWRSGLTIWDFQHFLIDKGFVSSYSLEDISRELKLIKKL